MKKFLLRCFVTLLLLALLTCLCAARSVIPGGNTIGLRVQTDGVAVAEVPGRTAKQAGLCAGDVILAVDGQKLTSAAALLEQVERSGGRALSLRVLRGETEETLRLAPQQTEEGWRLGLRVRDSVSGIGTVTFVDPETGAFGALGHGISDGTTLLPIKAGEVLASEIASVQRGTRGKPGALQGLASGRGTLGRITSNTARGIFGVLDSPAGACVELAAPAEVHTGPAVIRANVRGSGVEEFDVTICAIDPRGDRNLLLQTTDPELLTLTGGIVQGMSGSPIIQDGKLIGAVTHVLVNDPTTGYGIFIENMLDAAG